MHLATWIDGMGLTLQTGSDQVEVRSLTDDSRQVAPGGAFLARSVFFENAQETGHAYVGDAVDRGAGIVVVPHDVTPDLPAGVTLVTAAAGVEVDQALAGRLAVRLLGHPSRQLSLIGVTGTNGKTTVGWLTRHLLDQAGIKTGLIGTICVHDGDTQRPAILTTPGSIELSYLLREMVDNGCKAAVMEVSSHALEQLRTDALDFDVAVFTNLTGDHLDYHADMDQYAAAKARLFTNLSEEAWAVVNTDDPYAERMIRSRPQDHTIHTALTPKSPNHQITPSPNPSATAEVWESTASHNRATLSGGWGEVEVTLPLAGRFNVANALQAAAAANCVTDLSRTLRRSLANAPPVPGRLEPVGTADIQTQDPSPTVLVDYAHTHDALDNVLQALRPLVDGRLIVVIGCGGDREKAKRPKMARIASAYADMVWITSDNPRTEDPQAIIDDMLAGLDDPQRAGIHVEQDRAKAIHAAVGGAAGEDTVLIAGKGHEDYQIIGTEKRPFDDRVHAKDALARKID